MWCVVEYELPAGNQRTGCWAVPIAWLIKDTNTIYYPNWKNCRNIVSTPQISWSRMIYSKIMFDNIGK